MTLSAPFVPLTVTVSGWASPTPPTAFRSSATVVASVPVEVVDGDRVGAAERVEADALDVVEVQRDVRDVTREPNVRPVCGDADLLADVGAEEVEQVDAPLTLDGVAVVAGVPGEAVVAVTAQYPVVAVAAGHDVIALAAEERLRSRAAEQRVGSVAAVDRQRLVRERAVAQIDANLVIASTGLDVDRGERAAIEAEVGGAVRADVDLERARRAELKPEDELVARPVAGDLQRRAVELRLVGGLRLAGRAKRRGEDDGCENAQRQRSPPLLCRGDRSVHRDVLLSGSVVSKSRSAAVSATRS